MPITETYFPAFLQACDDSPHEILDIQLKCGICHEQMTFEDEADPHLRAFVLPCMHIFCKGCVDTMVANYRNDAEAQYVCPTCRAFLYCAHCNTPSDRGSLIHMDGEKSIALIENILKLWHNRWHCFSCDMKVFTSWLQILLKISQDCTEMANNGQILTVYVEYEGQTWNDVEMYEDTRLLKQEPLPRHLEVPIKIIEEGLLKAHGIAVPEDGSTVFQYELRLSEMRDRDHQFLVWQRRCITKTEQEMRDCWVGSRKLMVLDLAFDLRDYWSDENVRKKINERANLARESILREDEGVDDNAELPDMHRV